MHLPLPDPVQQVAAEVPSLPTLADPASPPPVTLRFHSSVSLLAPIPPPGTLPPAFLSSSSSPPAPAPFVKPPLVPRRCFFQKRQRQSSAKDPPLSPATGGLRLRTYRRTFPAASLIESVRILTWPHRPSSASPEARAAHLASLPDAEQAALTAHYSQLLSSACSSLLSLLSLLSLVPLRPYDLSLHVISPSSPPFAALIASHPIHSHLLSPLLYSLGFQRQLHSFVLTASPFHVNLHLQLHLTQLHQLQKEVAGRAQAESQQKAEPTQAENGAEMTAAFQVQRTAPPAADGGEEAEEAMEEDGEVADSAAVLTSPGGRRRPTMHSASHQPRRMPSQPTRARHDRSTFKPTAIAVIPPHRPTSPLPPPTAAPLPTTRPLAANVAGERRTLPVVLPRTFLAPAPAYPTPSPIDTVPPSARFQLQPSFLDLGPLLLGRRYEVRLWLMNVGVGYGRWRVGEVRGVGVRLGVEVRLGGLAGGLGKEVRVGVEAVGVGRVEGGVEVRGEGEVVRVEVEGEVVGEEAEWRRKMQGRKGLGMGVMGLVRKGGGLPGSLKDIRGDIGRVREVQEDEPHEGREESNEQWLYSRMSTSRQRARGS